jgi:hypothetical protein
VLSHTLWITIPIMGWDNWRGRFRCNSIRAYTLTHALTNTMPHYLTHYLTHSLPHSLPHSLTHSLTTSLTHLPVTHFHLMRQTGIPRSLYIGQHRGWRHGRQLRPAGPGPAIQHPQRHHRERTQQHSILHWHRWQDWIHHSLTHSLTHSTSS